MFVPQRHVDHTVVDERRERVGNGDFLSTTLGTSGYEDTAHLSGERGFAPEGAGSIPEGLIDDRW